MLGIISLFSFKKSFHKLTFIIAKILILFLGRRYLSKKERKILEEKTKIKEKETCNNKNHNMGFKEKIDNEYKFKRRSGIKQFLQSMSYFFIKKYFEELRYLKIENLVYFFLWCKKEDELSRKEMKNRTQLFFWNGLKRIHFLLVRVDKPKGIFI